MIIPNFQEFYNLFKDTPVPVVVELGGCINILNKICGCRKSQKQSKNEECNNLYINYVQNNKDSLIEYLKLKTNDNEVIFKHNTHYDILSLKIR